MAKGFGLKGRTGVDKWLWEFISGWGGNILSDLGNELIQEFWAPVYQFSLGTLAC